MRKINYVLLIMMLSLTSSYSSVNLKQLHERTSNDDALKELGYKKDKAVKKSDHQAQGQHFRDYNQSNSRDIQRLQEILDKERSGED